MSILNDIKPLVNCDVDNTDFDLSIITSIATALSILKDIGVGKADFNITGSNETWDDFFNGEEPEVQSFSKEYVRIKTQMLFDPPTSSVLLENLKKIEDEMLFRIDGRTNWSKKGEHS